jgi:hypothetical protein
MLELCDGRRLSITLSPIRTMPVSVGEVEKGVSVMAHPIDHGDLGLPLKGQSSRHWLTTVSEEAEDDEDVSVVWEDLVPSVGGRDLVYWADDEAPLEVALLAMCFVY